MFKFFVITRAQKPGVNNVPDREVCEEVLRLWQGLFEWFLGFWGFIEN